MPEVVGNAECVGDSRSKSSCMDLFYDKGETILKRDPSPGVSLFQ